MNEGFAHITIRPIEPRDTAACYEMRKRAFLEVFSHYLDEESMTAGAYAYDLAEFGRMLGEMVSSIAVESEAPVGFCTVRLLSAREAELLWLYVKLDCRGRGIGSRLARHAEELALTRYPGVSRLVLDTVVPEYNQTFYEGLGYKRIGEGEVHYPAAVVPAVRFRKDLPALSKAHFETFSEGTAAQMRNKEMSKKSGEIDLPRLLIPIEVYVSIGVNIRSQ